jgi:hypothetical protein
MMKWSEVIASSDHVFCKSHPDTAGRIICLSWRGVVGNVLDPRLWVLTRLLFGNGGRGCKPIFELVNIFYGLKVHAEIQLLL